MKNLGIYIHIPFCVKKCLYCDFVSYENCNEVLIEKYIENLINEIKKKEERLKENNILEKKESLKNYNVDTIYIGGGTPSFIDSKYIVKIINILKEKYNIEENCEITIEVNPGIITKEKIEDYKKIGINRISIGLQETNNNILKTIGRRRRGVREENNIFKEIFKGVSSMSGPPHSFFTKANLKKLSLLGNKFSG